MEASLSYMTKPCLKNKTSINQKIREQKPQFLHYFMHEFIRHNQIGNVLSSTCFDAAQLKEDTVVVSRNNKC